MVEFTMILLILTFLYFFFLYYWHLNKNSLARIWPVLGMFPDIIRNRNRIHESTVEGLEFNNETYRFIGPWFSNLNFVVTSDYRNMQYMLSKKFENFKRGPEFNEIFDAFGDGIFNADNELWKLQQKALHSLMKSNTFELAVQGMLRRKIEKGLFPILESFSQSGSVVDIQGVLHRFTFDGFCQLILGYDPGCLSIDFPSVEYEKAYDEIEEEVFRRHVVPASIWKLERWLGIGGGKKMKRARESFDKFLYDHILSNRERVGKRSADLGNSEQDFNLVSALLKEHGEKPDRFFRDVAFNLMAAGRDTVAATVSFLLWFVATHPKIEENILKEIKEKLNPDEDRFKVYNAKELSQLVYLHGVVSETLRLYPPVPFEHRAAVEADILPSGLRVAKNEKIFICIYAMGRSKKIWGEDCLEFKPERWISEQGGNVYVPSYKFMTFLTGPRTCLGKDTAFYQIKSIALFIIQNYHVRVKENHVLVPSNSMIMQIQHGLPVRLSKRHPC